MLRFRTKKILMVMAHPDDEIIFGWPLLQDDGIHKEILMCSSDENNNKRSWCKHRKEPLKEICDLLSIKLTVLPYDSEFYRYETRKETLKKTHSKIIEEINSKDYDYLFTHNPMGEYGHLDHKMLFDLVLCNVNKDKIIYTDICLPSNWLPYYEIPHSVREVFYKNKVGDFKNDLEFYEKIAKLYKSRRVWTWSQPAVKNCGIYSLGEADLCVE